MKRHGAPKAQGRAGDRLEEAARFLRTWAQRPLQLGSVTPSSRYLSRAIAEEIDPRGEGPVIEIGSGTGPVTDALIRRGIREDRLVLVEYSGEFCAILRRRFPQARVIQGDAYALTDTIGDDLAAPAAGVVCCLPLLTKPEPVRFDLLRQAFGLMQPRAPFVQFTYSLASPIPVRGGFFDAHASARIWRNVPPARVWVYRERAA